MAYTALNAKAPSTDDDVQSSERQGSQYEGCRGNCKHIRESLFPFRAVPGDGKSEERVMTLIWGEALSGGVQGGVSAGVEWF